MCVCLHADEVNKDATRTRSGLSSTPITELGKHFQVFASMIIPINLHPEFSKDGTKFPPQLAKLGTDEIILLELQGSFYTEGDAVGQQAAKLNLENVSRI